MIAAGGGLLLIISLFLNWYKVSAEGALVDISVSASGWDALGFIDILLFVIGIGAIALAAMRAFGMSDRVPIPTGFALLILGGIATLLVIFRLLVIPDADVDGIDIGRSIGVFVALIAALATLVGGWLSWNEEGRATSVGAGSPGGGAVGAGQPGGYGAPPQGAPVASSAPPAAAAAPAATAPPAGGAATGADAPPPGGKADWYPDPRGQKRLRYYDGTSWTDHVAD